jgi:hypothetical protein
MIKSRKEVLNINSRDPLFDVSADEAKTSQENQSHSWSLITGVLMYAFILFVS